MDSEVRQPETSALLRLVDLQIDGEHRLHFGGGFTGVLTAPDARSSAARLITTTIVGPRPSGCAGAIDVGGQLMSVWSLPSPLVPLGTPVVLDSDLVRTVWKAACARQREELAATHARRRMERHRLDVAIEQAGVRPLPAVVMPDPHRAMKRDPEAELAGFRATVQGYSRVQALLATINAFEQVPSTEARHVADLIEANAALLKQRDEIDAHNGGDVGAAAHRVKLARIGLAIASAPVRSEQRDALEQTHRAVGEAREQLAAARRRGRSDATAKYQAAVVAEQAALADAGVESYAMFLLMMSAGEPESVEHLRASAKEEVEAALIALDAAKRTGNLPTKFELDTQAEELRGRARELLGHEPGDDPLAELRSLRVDRPERAVRLRELEAALRSAAVEDTGDALGDARAFVESPPSLHVPQPPAWPKPTPREPLSLGDIEALEKQSVIEGTVLDGLEAEMQHLDAVADADLVSLGPDDLARVMESTLDAYRAGEVLEGRLPLVFDGVLDGIMFEARDAAVLALSAAEDLQVIIVSDDPEVTQSVGAAGGSVVGWPELGVQRPSAAHGLALE